MGVFSTKIAKFGVAAALLTVSVSASAEFKFNAVASFPTATAGVYSFSTSGYDPVLIKRDVFASGGGIAYDDGYFYGVRYENVMGLVAVSQTSYNLKTWEIDETYTGGITDIATANTFDADLGQAYGCYFNEDGETFRFCSVNVPYWVKTKIADLPKAWSACGFNKDLVLYAIDEDGMLLTVNTDNGALTEVGDTGLKTDWITGGIVDKESNVMIYAIKTDAETALYSVDLATAKATKLYDLANEEQLGGFYVEQVYAGGVPGKGYSKPSLSISGTNLNGTLAFYTPTTTYDGNKGTGAITYHVYANGKEIATGEAAFDGKRMSVPVEVEKAGYYTFAVSFSNETGEGPRLRADSKYLGVDTPKAPASITVTYADGKASVRWGAVSGGVHNGTIDRANLTYRLTRYPDAVVVTPEDHKTNSFTDEIPAPAERTTYWYTVEAVTGDIKSAPAKSSSFDLGPVTPPYSTEFASSNDFIGYSTIATDGKKWQYDNYEKRVYVSTSAAPADNWLVLPELKVKGGESYEFKILLAAHSSSYTEKFEVKGGTAADASALTSTVIAKSTVSGSGYTEFTGSITPEADGTYYVGVHATTASGGDYLYVKSISISSGVSDRAPAAIENLAVTSDAAGAHEVSVVFNVPSLTLGGAQLDEVTKAEIFRDDELIATVTEGLEPGKEVTFVDEDAPAGNHTYSVVCHNGYGAGSEVKASTFVGFAAPAVVASVTMTEPSNGHVAASWTPVTTDVDGRTLTVTDVRYNVYKYLAGDVYPVAENVEGTTIEYGAFDGFEDFDGQRFVQTLVEAVTEGGKSKLVPSAQTPVGNPYTAPWSESFAGCKINSIFANQIVSGSDAWGMVPQDDFGTVPADGDGGMMYLEAYGRGACSLISGKIDLADVVAPALIFQVYHYASSSPNENLVEVEVRSDGEFTKLYSSKIMDMGEEGKWCKVTVPMDDFEGQTIQFRITAYCNTFAFTHLDDMKITSAAPDNLAISSLTAPATVEPNTEFNITVEIENLGTQRALGYKVHLFRDDMPVETKSGAALESGEKTTVQFSDNLDILSVGDHSYTVEIEYGPDMFLGDNVREFNITVRSNSLPTVNDLDGTTTGDGVSLTWSAPANLTVPAAATETFDAPSLSWATAVPGWTFVDKDGGTIGGIGSKQLPVSGRQSFFVFDNTFPALQNGNISAFNAHSGNQYLCSMYTMVGGRGIASDDWAITPELNGAAQTISLWATSFPADPDQPQYLETFQLLYSTTGTNTDDFILIEEFPNIPAQWREYTAYLPDGAKYFAIRCISNFQYMLFVDDVTFIAKNSGKADVEILGYNVYRDGKRLNTEPVVETSYTDATVDFESSYTYVVTTVSAAGESLPSNEVTVDSTVSGLSSLGAAAVSVRATASAAVVTGAEGLAIAFYTADGKLAAAAKGEARTTVALPAGFYIYRVGALTGKIVIR